MTIPIPLRNDAVQKTMASAVKLLMDDGNRISTATADLLDIILDDMNGAGGVYLRTAWAGTDSEHPTVFDEGGHRLEWTWAYNLAQAVIEELG